MRALRTAVIVVGAAALVATGIGALGTAGVLSTTVSVGATASGSIAGFAGISAATWTAIGAIGGAAAAIGGALTAGRPSFGGGGSPTDFTTNPQSGLPYPIGRTRMSGLKIDGKTSATPGWTTTHDLVWFAVLLGIAGPMQAIESFTADNVAVTFDPTTGNATSGEYVNWMAQKVYLGAPSQATGLSLSLNGGSFPGWPRKLSGMAHALWGLRHDSDGKHYSGGVPEPSWVGRWVKVYDPRKDSTYPGGSGTHRSNDEATWEWSRNPALHALTWAIGRTQNGKRICGIGAPIASIRVADFVEAANVADANGWGCGGVEWTTDSKWDIFKRMLQAGGAVPTKTGAMIGCRVKTPRVSLGTIQEADFLDGITYVATKGRRNRFNTVVPRYVSEAHNWQVIAGSEIGVPAYVTADGGKRTKGIDFPLVQDEIGQAGFDGKKQAGQLAAYEIVDSREASLEFTTKPKWIGLRTGDCVTLNSPQDDIVNMKVVITSRTVDPATMTIRFTAETETDSKHAFALGQTSTPPPAPTLSVPAGRPAVPSVSDWAVTQVTMGDGLPGLRVSGTIGDLIADRMLVQYRQHGTTDWIIAPDIVGRGSKILDIGPLNGSTDWDVRLAYQAGMQRSDWLEISSVGTGVNAILAGLSSSTQRGTAFPSAADSAAGQLFIRTDLENRWYLRVAGDGLIYDSAGTIEDAAGVVEVYEWEEIVDERVAQAIADAATAQAAADAAREDAAEALSALTLIASDGYLTQGEKPRVIQDVTVLNAEQPGIDLQADALVITTERTAYDAALAALNAYLATLTTPTAWNNLSGDTVVVGATFRSKFADVYTTRQALLNKISDRLNGKVNNALDQIASIASDNVLSRGEKPHVQREYDALYENWFALDAKASSLGIAGAQRSAANAAMSALYTYLSGLTPGWTDATLDTPIVGTTFKAKWDDAYAAVAALQAAIQGQPGEDGVDGIDGANGYTVTPTGKSFSIAANAAGIIKSGELPKSVTFQVLQGLTDISTDGATSYGIGSSANVSASLASNVLSITDLSDDTGFVEVTVSRSGVPVAVARFDLGKAKDGTNASFAQTLVINPGNSSSYGSTGSNPLTIPVGPNGTVTLAARVSYSVPTLNSVQAAKWQYRTQPGTGGWTDVAAETVDPVGASAGNPSVFNVNATIAGPAAGANWEFQLVTRQYSGLSSSAVASGSNRASASWAP